ncbi:MAG: hypothetical protein JW862_14205, partial [Anaerolineales bacterium]|nr:hypothetical protein [Anaerolineales bacterium]
TSGAAGVAGSGPGGGGGGNFGNGFHGPGGGGGGYGGSGGGGGMTLESPPEAPGGPFYGSNTPPGIEMGSGGGSAANHLASPEINLGGAGGNGGGAVSLTATTIVVDGGSILAAGGAGQSGVYVFLGPSAGGGGSGGGIWLDGCIALLNDAELSAFGGQGGDSSYSGGWYTGGGGGGGGRIKLSGILDSTSVYSTDVAGGPPGLTGPSWNVYLYPSPGTVGSLVNATSTGNCLLETTAITGDGYSDGWVLERAENYDTGYQTDNKTKLLRVGDDRADRQYQTILSFDTSGLSALDVQGASLLVKPYNQVGDPFSLGQLCLESAGGYFHNSWRLERQDFEAPGTAGSCATLNDAGWYEFSISAAGIDANGWSQFRLYFDGLDDNDNRSDDYLMLYGGYSGGNAPLLEVEYLP